MNLIARIPNADGEVYAVLSYQPTLNYLLMDWIGFCTADELMQATLRMLDWQQTEGIRRNCSVQVHNTKEMNVAWNDTVDWIANDFFPRAYQAGLRYNISILSPDLFTKLSSEALHQHSNSKVPTLLFETLPEAEKWIASHVQGPNQPRA